ncbi:hypothetical protein PLCT1_01108 [Planctomycetaceae bacterium]|nr:hypothetical protein PLCT1_01108 [Planctomycetaceae bacterium]
MTPATTHEYTSFQIVVLPSPDTNDHEVRFIADGVDLIESFCEGSLGLDPDDVLLPNALAASSAPHVALIARCDCGVIGCGDIEAEITLVGEVVTWVLGPEQSGTSPILRFAAASYIRELERATADTSWETPDRTAARLLRASVNQEMLAAHDLRFLWASGRVRDHTFTVSLELSPGPYQVLLHIPWRDQSPGAIASEMATVIETPPESWRDVQFFPQRPGLTEPPPIAGPGWRGAT